LKKYLSKIEGLHELFIELKLNNIKRIGDARYSSGDYFSKK